MSKGRDNFSVSVKTNAEVFASPFALPEAIQWENFHVAWSIGKLNIAIVNSGAAIS